MYPLTENFPKPLLEIKGKPLIDYLIDDLSDNSLVSKYIVVSNHKFIAHFNSWKKTRKENIVILDDGSTDNENRLGAVKDIAFAIEREKIDEDIIVLAGDNLLDFSLKGFVDFSNNLKCNAVMRYYEDCKDKLQRTGVAVIDNNSLITDMEEKPSCPKSNWAIPPFYIFKQEAIKEIDEGIKQGCKVDAPGGFIEWFCKRNKVYAYQMPGKRIDVGNLEQYYKMK
jgi:glucose-1-phosphate thymidylyltransferase